MCDFALEYIAKYIVNTNKKSANYCYFKFSTFNKIIQQFKIIATIY